MMLPEHGSWHVFLKFHGVEIVCCRPWIRSSGHADWHKLDSIFAFITKLCPTGSKSQPTTTLNHDMTTINYFYLFYFDLLPLAQSCRLEMGYVLTIDSFGILFVRKCAQEGDPFDPLDCYWNSLEEVGGLERIFCSHGHASPNFFNYFCCLSVSCSSSFNGYRCENMGLVEVSIFEILLCGFVVCCCTRLCWCLIDVRVGKGVRYCDVPCQWFSSCPWNLTDAVWSSAVSGAQSKGFFLCQDLCMFYCTPNDIIDFRVSLLTRCASAASQNVESSWMG